MKNARQLPPPHLGYGWFALLLRFGLVAFVAVVGAAKVNLHDPVWATAFLVALAIALVGVGILAWESWTFSESDVCRYCGYALLILGIVGLVVISFFAQWFTIH
ncbi:MAG: hypothetical protein ABSD58_07140 [Verrucomicrobiia bacterium]|jgi:hypothetical protein